MGIMGGDIEQGIEIIAGNTARKVHTILVREGCSGSPNCALEIYVSHESVDYLNGPNLHMTDDEAEQLYQAIKAVRRARRKATRA